MSFTSIITCSDCGRIIESHHDALYYNDDYICRDCFDQSYTLCAGCGEIVHMDNTTYVEGGYWCDGCRDRRFRECEHCGEWIRRYNSCTVNVADGDTEEWCSECAINYSTYCNECGERFSDADFNMEVLDGYNLCESCYEEKLAASDINRWKAPRGVQRYGYKPIACFCPAPDNSEIFYGYELEMESHGKDRDDAADFINDRTRYTYCKHDGSLDEGLEVVSHPATLEYHTGKKEVYREIFEQLADQGWRSHVDGTCGLHVHISKGPVLNQNRYAIANLLLFFDYHWNRLVNFSRRKESQLERWAQRYHTGHIPYNRITDDASNTGEYDRYMAINLHNDHTIEIRMFRGTLNVDTFIATLQLVDVLVRKAIELGCDFEAAKSINWNDLVKSDYEELNAYLKKRGLYDINGEPIEDVEEYIPDVEEVISEDTGLSYGEFRVGDRVVFTYAPEGGYSFWFRDNYTAPMHGTIVTTHESISGHVYGVAFDDHSICTHTLNGYLNRNYGQWVRARDIQHEEITPDCIGRRVRFNPTALAIPTSRTTGVIRAEEWGDYGIEIEGFIGHNCNGAITGNNGWWIPGRELVLIED